jgi:GNAT superfamily N-acetyltransferase
MSAPDPRIRPVTPADVAAVTTLVHDLAGYEKSPEQCRLTDQQLHAALFGPSPALFGLVEGAHGIYLEDLFVRPELRGCGLGKALLIRLAQIAVERGYARVEWSVLDWNTPSIDFYRSLGAAPMDEWTTFRLTGPALRTAAGTG